MLTCFAYLLFPPVHPVTLSNKLVNGREPVHHEREIKCTHWIVKQDLSVVHPDPDDNGDDNSDDNGDGDGDGNGNNKPAAVAAALSRISSSNTNTSTA